MIDCLSSNWLFFACLLLAAILSLIPVIGKFLNVFNTLFHESGHAIMALLTGGGVMNIKLSADASGAAQTKSKYWMGKVLTSIAGYPVSSVSAWLFFYLIQQHSVIYIFYIIFSLLLINLVLWVRNTFGIVWILVMGILTFITYFYGSEQLKHYFAVFCASILLFQSIYTSLTLLIIAFKNPSKAGDAKNLQAFTYIPTLLWALLLFSFAIFVAFKIILILPCYAII